jgi:transposase
MSMYPQALGSIPEETVRVARAACPKGTLAMRLRDTLGELYQDEQFAALYPVEGQPAYAPWRLAIVTVLQSVEGLTDRQAADAVRERIDWKYSLGLDLTDPGFDFSLLSEFRLRLVEEGAETLLLDRLLEVCKQRGWLKAESQRTALAQQIGADGWHLLQALQQPDAPAELKEVASVHLLQQVWQQYYDLSGGQANWRAGPQASEDEGIIRSPYDPQAQTGKKRDQTWLGYTVHFTETCALQESEQEQAMPIPHLIVQVPTTVAPVQDVEVTATIQEELAKRDLLPEEQLVDTGYVDAELLVSSQQQHGIKWGGPV